MVMQQNSLISVIIPIYNGGSTLTATLNSILKQTITNFEVILINDGSTDDTEAVCKRFVNEDTRFRYIATVNGGVTSARRTGWLNSNGRWLVFVDADDELAPNGLEILYNLITKNSCQIVNACFKSTASGRIWLHRQIGFMDRKRYLQSLLVGKTYGTLYASIYASSLFQESSFQFDRSIKIGEDVLTCIELATRVDMVLNTQEVVYFYNDHNDSSVMNRKVRHPEYFERIHEVTSKLLSQEPDLLEELKLIRLETLKIKLLKAYFSPTIPTDKNYASKLLELFRDYKGELSTMDSINLFILKNHVLSFCYKKIKLYLFKLRHIVTYGKVSMPEILY